MGQTPLLALAGGCGEQIAAIASSGSRNRMRGGWYGRREPVARGGAAVVALIEPAAGAVFAGVAGFAGATFGRIVVPAGGGGPGSLGMGCLALIASLSQALADRLHAGPGDEPDGGLRLSV